MMDLTVSAPASPEEAAHRGRLYKLLALGFSYPDAEFHAAVRDGEYLQALLTELCAVDRLTPVARAQEKLLAKGGKILKKTTSEEFEVFFTSTFDVGNPTPPCPPYEGLYLDGEDRAALMVEISAFYRFFGLGINSGDGYIELPDHLCAELEFMHFLAIKEAEARTQQDEKQIMSLLRAQHDFLARHPQKWVPLFAARLKKKDALPWYVQLARLTAAVVDSDLKCLTETIPQPRVMMEERDCLQPVPA